MIAEPASRGQSAKAHPPTGVLAQLLHALNQPLTGLQCSIEVALASPRTVEQYVQRLREGLELTERMRALVETIREVANVDEGLELQSREIENRKFENQELENQELDTMDVNNTLREAADDLAPVAEMKGVHMGLNCSPPFSLVARGERRRTARTIFRLLESALSLADPGSLLQVETGGRPEGAWIRIRWQGEVAPRFSRPELGLLIAQAGWERDGAEWERKRTENVDTVTIRLPVFGGP